MYQLAAAAVLVVHLLWLLFVIFGAFFTARRPLLAGIHVIALVWGILVEVGPWPCPLTALEQHLNAGAGGYSDSFLLHYLDALVYPDISPRLLVTGAVAVCAGNLAIYGARYVRSRRRH